MGILAQEVRHAARTLLRSPVFTAATAATLALAIGANAAIFSLVNAVLLRPLPGVAEPERLVNVHATTASGEAFGSFSYLDSLDFREEGRAFVDLAAFRDRGMSLGSGERTKLVAGQLVSGNYFDVLGVKPHLGRLLQDGDDRTPGGSPVAVVSHAFWQGQLGADPAVVGHMIRLNGFPFAVVGVTPPGFSGHFVGFPFDVWVPLTMAAQAAPGESLERRDSAWLELVGRLRPGVSLGLARTSLAAVASRLDRQHPEPERGRGADVRHMTGVDDSLRDGVVGFLALLQSIAGLALLIACVNVAGLLLARGLARRREIAVRLAIGAGRRDLIRQLLAETLLLFAVGGACGLVLAGWTAHLLVAFQPRFPIPLRLDLPLDLRVVAATAVATLATGLAFGLAPALQAAHVDVVPALKEGGAAVGKRGSRARSLFVVTQVALSVTLLVGAGLFLRCLHRSRSLDPGFDPEGVQMASLDLSILARDEARGREFYRRLLEQLESVPGVESASLARMVPLSLGSLSTPVEVEGFESPSGRGFTVDLNMVTPRYFETLRIPLVAGRGFFASDVEGAAAVAIVSQAMARRFWPGREAVGQRVRRGSIELRVVGVARDAAHRRFGETPRPHLYLPLAQSYEPGVSVLVRAAEGPAAVAVAGRIRREIRALDPDLPVLTEMPLREYIGRSLVPQRIAGTVTGALGALGLLLSSVGLYGVVSFFVGQRTREIGLRMALGARPSDVLRLVLQRGLALASAGVALGLVGAAAASRLVASFLPGVSPTDPLAFAAAAAAMVAVTLFASFAPARRAASLDPMTALRYE